VTLLNVATVLLLLAGGVFFLAGTVGVLRFPDARSRLHGVAKADTLGLGFVIVALLLHSGSIAVAVKLVVIWLLAITSSAVASYLFARRSSGGSP
jgi:multicomponent Na+:H+ antiporter subunit G